MLKKMRHRFILAAMAAFALVGAILIIGINYANYARIQRGQEISLQRIYEYDQREASRPASSRPPGSKPPWNDESGDEFTVRFFVVHCSRDGELLRFGDDYIFSVDEEKAELYAKTALSGKKEKGHFQDYAYKIFEDNEDLTIVFLNIARDRSFIYSLIAVSLLVGAVGLALVFVLVVILSKRAIRPYVDNIERQKRFITDAGHELKTPITSIAMSADIAVMKFGEDEWLSNIQDQTARLARLTNDLVTLSRLDEASPYPEKRVFSLSEAAVEIEESLQPRADAEGKRIRAEYAPNLEMVGDRGSIQRMISVLLDNALKYSLPESEISLRVYRERKKAVIEVSNAYDASEKPDLERLFDRFYRPDDSRSSKTGGSGLGLSIARMIAETHGGTLTASLPEQGVILFRAVL